MTLQIYLRWDGMTEQDKEAQTYGSHYDIKTSWTEGRTGFLHGFVDSMSGLGIMLDSPWAWIDHYGYDEVPLDADKVEQRMVDALSKVYSDDELGGEVETDAAILVGFASRVRELQALGLNPRLKVSY